MSAAAHGEPRCPACGGPGRSRRYKVEHFDLYRCELCGTEFLYASEDRPRAEATYWDAYKFEIYADDAVRDDYANRYEQILGRVESEVGPIRSLVDIGCGIGNFLLWAQERGVEAVGVDVDHDAIATARERGLDARHVDDLDALRSAGGVDAVTLWDVIEHVDDPLDMLETARSLLRPGGVVIMETPDVRFPARPFVIAVRKVAEPIRWSDMLYYSDHQTYFSARGLSTLLGRAGFDVIDQQGMRSPSAKMERLFRVWADAGSGAGKLGPVLYKPLDRTMQAAKVTNKLIMVGRTPEGD